MKFICFTLTAIWLILSGAELAYGEPVTAAIFGAVFAASTAGQFVSLGIALAFNLGVGLIQKARAKAKAKDQTRGISFELQVGDDQPMSFTVGKFAAGGRRKYTGIYGNNSRYFVDVIELENVPNPGRPEYWVNDQKIVIDYTTPDSDGKGFPSTSFIADGDQLFWVKYYDGTQTVADPYLVAKFGADPDRPWASDMIGRGCPYLIVTARFNPENFPSVPGVLTETPVRPFYDLRKDSTNGGSGTHRWNNQSTWEPTQNPIIIAYNIVRGIYFGSEWVYGGQNLAAFRLPASNWIAAANECDVNITLTGGGTEKQFRCGYEVFCDVEPLTVIEELLQTCNGRMAEVGGIFKVMVGAPGAAVFSFTDADVLVTEGQSFNPFPPFSDTHNGIEATYPEPAEKWATKDAPARYSSTYMTADLDQQLVVGVEFEACPFKTQVQRVMKTMLQEERRFRTHEFYLPPSAWRLEPNDVVSWTSVRNGYVNKKFLVVRAVGRRTFNQLVSLKEIDPSDYDWAASEELPTVVGPVKPIKPDPQPMTGWTAVGYTVLDTNSRARRPGIKVTAGANLDDVKNVRVQVRLKSSGAVVFDSDATPYDAPYEWVISGQWTLPITMYQTRGKFMPFTSRTTNWGGWLDVLTPDVQFISEDILDGAIISSKINDAAIIASKIAAEAVTSIKLAANAVTETKIAVDAVTRNVIKNGEIIASKIADGAMELTKFASGLRPVEGPFVTAPTTGNVEGRVAMIGASPNAKLMRYTGGAWTAAVPTVDLVGTVNSAQIADGAITNLKLGSLAVALANLQDGAVTSVKIADAALTTAKFASGIEPVGIIAGAVVPTTKTTNVITVNGKMYRWSGASYVASVPAVDVTGQLTDSQIADLDAAKMTGQITSTQINDGAITTPKILAGAVVAGSLAAGAVVAGKIAAGAVTATALAAGSVVAGKIAAGVITATELASDSVTAAKIVAGTITATEIAANAITTAKIAAGAVTAGEIAANAVTAVKIEANAVVADKIAANAVLAKHIVVSDFENMILDGNFDQALLSFTDIWAMSTNNFMGTSNSAAGSPPAFWLSPSHVQTGSYSLVIDNKTTGGSTTSMNMMTKDFIPCTTADTLAWEVTVKTVDVSNSATGFYVRFRWYDAAGVEVTPQTDGLNNQSIPTAFLTRNGQVVVPVGVTKFKMQIYHHNTSTTRYLIIDRIVVRKAKGAELIVDGTIIADKISTNAVTADKISANAITAGKIAANAVTASAIAAEAVTAAKIQANAITADKIAANVIGARQLIVADFSNLILDSSLTDSTAWGLGGSFDFGAGWAFGIDSAQGSGIRSIRHSGAFSGVTDAEARYYAIDYIPVEELKEYAYGGYVDPTASTTGIADFVLTWYTAAKAVISSVSTIDIDLSASNARQANSGINTAPATAAFCRFIARRRTAAGASTLAGTVDYTNMFVRRASNGELIVDGTIVAEKIATNAITSAKIEAGAIIASKIQAGAITAVAIQAGSITGDRIAAATIYGDRIVGSSITARELILADFSNVFPDYDTLAQTGFYTGVSPGVADLLGSSSADRGKNIVRIYTDSVDRSVYSDWISIEQGDYYAEVSIQNATGGAGSGTCRCYIQFATIDAAGVATYNGRQVTVAAKTDSAASARVGANFTAVAGERAYRVRYFKLAGGSTTSAWFGGMFIRRRYNSNLIVDGAITADHLAVNSITVGKIASNAVTAVTIANGAITAAKIAAGAITADMITTGLMVSTNGKMRIDLDNGAIEIYS